MPYERRSVLKLVGAVGVGSVGAVGRVAAGESKCTETVQTVEIDQVGSPALFRPRVLPEEQIPVGVGGTAVAVPHYTQPFSVDAGAFESSELPENRASAVLTWNGGGEGPTTCGFTMEQKNIAGEWEQIADERNQSQQDGDGPVTENREELVAVDGEEHLDEADNETQSDQRNTVIIEGGGEYRFAVWPRDGVVTPQITVEFQAFDPACLDEDTSEG